MEVFCAMQYDLNGQCVPSRFFDVDNDNSGLGGWTQHIYPLRGQRLQNLWEELYLRAQLKVKVVRYYFFALILKKDKNLLFFYIEGN